MKKLMIAATVVGALGLSLYAAEIGGVDFEGRDIGALDITKGDESGGLGDVLWARSGTTAGDSEVVQGTAEPNTSKYLKIDESDVLERKLAPLTQAIPENGGISVVSKVQFTAQDESDDPPAVATGSKLAIWMKKVISGETTNNVLVVTANQKVDQTVSQHNYEFTDLGLSENTWYTLEVKAELVNDLPAFKIKIGDTQLVNPDDSSNFFLSLDQTTEDMSKIASIGFKGTGAADDLVFTDYVNELPVEVAVSFVGMGEEFLPDTLTAKTNDGEAVDISDTLKIPSFLASKVTNIVVTATAEGYKTWTKTYTGTSLADLVEAKQINITMEADKTPTEKFLEDIANATAGDTVTATGAIEIDAPIAINKDLTIDLAGNTLTYTGDSWALRYGDTETGTAVISNGTITSSCYGVRVNAYNVDIKDVTITATKRALQVTGTSTFNLDADSTATTSSNDPTFFINTKNGAANVTTPSTITIAGKVLNTYDQWPADSRTAYAICLHGNDTAGANVTIADGAEIKSDNMAAIYFPAAGSLTINAATVEGTEGVYVKAGTTAVVNGATIKGTLTSDKVETYVKATDGFKNTGDAFVVDNADYPAGAPSVTISGGTFTSVAGKAVASYGDEPITGFISGGAFSSDPTALLAADYKAVEDAGTWTVVACDYVAQVGDTKYETVAEAFAKVQELEQAESFPITVTAIKAFAGNLGPGYLGIAAEDTITITKGSWEFSGAVTFGGTIAGTFKAPTITPEGTITLKDTGTIITKTTGLTLTIDDPTTKEVKTAVDGEWTTYTVGDKPPAGFVITIAKSTGVSSTTATVDGEPYEGTALATGTKLLVTVAADASIKFPIYKLAIGELGAGVLSSNVYEYTVADAAATLTFTAKAAAFDDPQTDAEDVANAVANTASPENAAAAKAKVENIAGSDKAAAQDVASWMATKSITADQLAGSDYTQASYALKTDALLTSATEVEVDSIDAADGTVAVTVKIDDKDATKEEVEQYVQLSNDLSDATAWAALPVSTLKSAVTIEDGKIVITPVSGIDKLFLKVVIPQDTAK